VDICSRSAPCIDNYICIAHKVRYWRTNGTPMQVPLPFRQSNIDGHTGRELEREVITEAKASGREIHRQSATYF
jgi:hypothetical protein